MEQIRTKVLVVGGGPGGYVAAIRCGQLGLDTILVEKDRVGGTCLIRGCIPSKALIHAASHFASMRKAGSDGLFGIRLNGEPEIRFGDTIAWKDGIVDQLNTGVASLLKKAKVRTLRGTAVFSDAKTCKVSTESGDVAVSAEQVILAAGSVPVELSFLPFGGQIISSTEALSLPVLPKTLVVVGGGYIGLELGIAFRKLGVGVTIVEAGDRILPSYDEKLVAPVRRWLDRHDVSVHTNARVIGQSRSSAIIIDAANGERFSLDAEKILVTVGRRPALDGWGFDEMSVALEGRFIKVDERCATSMKNVWAIGDVVGEPMLAHKASAQGEMVAEIIAGRRRRFDPVAIPAVCFTEPEIVCVAMTQLPSEETVTSTFPFSANGRALSMGAGGDGGFVRVTARKADNRIVKIEAVGEHVSELSGEFTYALESGALLEDVGGTIHAHPTLSEAFHEAALRGLGHAIHI